jgi:hypothetical protein
MSRLDPEMTVIAKPDAVIANGASLSNVVCKKHYRRALLFIPADWTAADITFAVCDTPDGTFNKLTYGLDGSEVTVTVAVDTVIALDGKVQNALEACPYFKIRSGTAAVPVNQLAERTIRVVLMR